MLVQRFAFLKEKCLSLQDLSSDQTSCLISYIPVLCPQESITLEDDDDALGQVCRQQRMDVVLLLNIMPACDWCVDKPGTHRKIGYT